MLIAMSVIAGQIYRVSECGLHGRMCTLMGCVAEGSLRPWTSFPTPGILVAGHGAGRHHDHRKEHDRW